MTKYGENGWKGETTHILEKIKLYLLPNLELDIPMLCS